MDAKIVAGEDDEESSSSEDEQEEEEQVAVSHHAPAAIASKPVSSARTIDAEWISASRQGESDGSSQTPAVPAPINAATNAPHTPSGAPPRHTPEAPAQPHKTHAPHQEAPATRGLATPHAHAGGDATRRRTSRSGSGGGGGAAVAMSGRSREFARRHHRFQGALSKHVGSLFHDTDRKLTQTVKLFESSLHIVQDIPHSISAANRSLAALNAAAAAPGSAAAAGGAQWMHRLR